MRDYHIILHSRFLEQSARSMRLPALARAGSTPPSCGRCRRGRGRKGSDLGAVVASVAFVKQNAFIEVFAGLAWIIICSANPAACGLGGSCAGSAIQLGLDTSEVASQCSFAFFAMTADPLFGQDDSNGLQSPSQRL